MATAINDLAVTEPALTNMIGEYLFDRETREAQAIIITDLKTLVNEQRQRLADFDDDEAGFDADEADFDFWVYILEDFVDEADLEADVDMAL